MSNKSKTVRPRHGNRLALVAGAFGKTMNERRQAIIQGGFNKAAAALKKP